MYKILHQSSTITSKLQGHEPISSFIIPVLSSSVEGPGSLGPWWSRPQCSYIHVYFTLHLMEKETNKGSTYPSILSEKYIYKCLHMKFVEFFSIQKIKIKHVSNLIAKAVYLSDEHWPYSTSEEARGA